MNRRLRRLGRRHKPRIGARSSTLGAFSPSSSDQDWQTFDADLTQLETSVAVLRQRFEQQRALLQQQRQIEQQLQMPGLSAQEIGNLQHRLEALELQLESQLFDWQALQEPFWQAVRFGGIGIVLGWILKAIAGA
ncbi:MAG: hypothetical protein AAF773_22085 [Cyanobacteria bacterium P01_D01_bin.115]